MLSPNYQLSLATKEDLVDVVNLAEKLFHKSYYSRFTSFDFDVVLLKGAAIIDSYPKSVIVCIKVDDELVGFLCGSILDNLFNTFSKTAVELGFYITDRHRTRHTIKLLYGAYRYWAKLQGCDLLQMGKITDKNKPESFYYRKLK